MKNNIVKKEHLEMQSTASVWSLKHIKEDRRDLEDSLSLSDVINTESLPSVRSDMFSSSGEMIMHSGALTGSAVQKQTFFHKTKKKRIAAYMSLDSKTVAETKGWRIRAAYRMISYMARIVGDLVGATPLSAILHSEIRPDPTRYPFIPKVANPIYGTQYIRAVVDSMQHINGHYSLDPAHTVRDSGFTYLPPPVPDESYPVASCHVHLVRNALLEPEGYTAENDALLALWCEAYGALASFMQIDQGSLTEPEAGVFGTVGMFSPKTARFLWPTRDEVLLYEDELMLWVFDLLCDVSAQQVERLIMEQLGYSRTEAVMLAKTALRVGTDIYAEDFDMNKIRELKSLEIIADTAKDGADTIAQLAARKQLQLVSGLTNKTDTHLEDAFRTMAEEKQIEGEVYDLDTDNFN